MEIETDKAIYTVGKELVIRRLFTKDGKALPSANVVFKMNKCKEDNKKDSDWDEITAYGGGFGHGCGLSQYGAMYMAKDCGMSFETILKHYYNGICLGTRPFELKDKYITQCFYAPKKKAILVIPNTNGMKNLQVKINDTVIDLEINNNGRTEIDISEYIKPKTLNTAVFTPACHNPNDTRKLDRIKHVKMYIKLL